MEVLITAVVVSLLSPVVLAIVTGRQRRAEKQLDWAREDVVAEKAAEVAKVLGAKLDSTKETTIKAVSGTNKKLDTIHTLVNSNMTAAMQSELDALVAQLALMREVISLKGTPSDDTMNTVKILEGRIAELRASLHDRTKVQEGTDKVITK